MKDTYFTLIKNERIAHNTYLSVLEGDTSDITAAGQFVNIKLDGFYLRRPISVCDVEGDRLTIIYKAVGAGTEKMSKTALGEKWLVLTGLGNGYDLEKSGEEPLLIGGGAGVPPMYYLARKLVAQGKHPTVILGFGKADEVFFKEEFESLGLTVLVTTVDGSFGIKGFVTDAMAGIDYTYFYTCGPICGLVQIPCIERNAHAAARALDANVYATFADGVHRISYDKTVEVMKQTGHDLPSLYRETSEGGLAKNWK